MTHDQTTDAVEIKSCGFLAILSVSATLTHRLTDTVHEVHQRFSWSFEHLTDEPPARAYCVEQARQWAAYQHLRGYDVVATDSAGNHYP